MDCSTPGFPVLHQLLELAQTHVQQVNDTIQPYNPLLSLSPLSPPPFNLSQHQGLSLWVSSLHQVIKVVDFQLQHQSFQCYILLDAVKMNFRKYLNKIVLWNQCFKSMELQENLFLFCWCIYILYAFFFIWSIYSIFLDNTCQIYKKFQTNQTNKQKKTLFNSVKPFVCNCTHSSVLAWRISGMGEPGGLPSMGLHIYIYIYFQ